MVITNSIIKNKSTQRNGSIKVREIHTDHTNKDFITNYIVNEESEIEGISTKKKNQIEEHSINNEKELYLKNILEGENMFLDKPTPDYNTREEVLNHILDFLFKNEDIISIIKALPLFDMLSDEELIGLRQYTQEEVNQLRNKVNNILNGIVNYTPVEVE